MLMEKLFSRAQSKGGILVTGIVSFFVGLIILLLLDNLYVYSDQLIYHIIGLEMVASVILIGAAIKEKQKLFVPWIVTTSFFIYLLVYMAILYVIYLDRFFPCVIFLTILIVTPGCLCFNLWAVMKAFINMEKNDFPTYNHYAEKAWQGD